MGEMLGHTGSDRLVHVVLAGIVGASLMGCSLLPFQLPSRTASSPTAIPPTISSTPAAPSPTAPSPTAPSPTAQPTASSAPFVVLVAPSLTASHPEDYACLTASYFINVTWQQNQAQISFGRRPAVPIFREMAATVQANSDGSFTYAFTQAALYYTRVYPDRTCLFQVIEPASNLVTLEESGSLGMIVPIN